VASTCACVLLDMHRRNAIGEPKSMQREAWKWAVKEALGVSSLDESGDDGDGVHTQNAPKAKHTRTYIHTHTHTHTYIHMRTPTATSHTHTHT
jgi:hypothetical protein